jgi:hypothetical protein
MCCDVASRSDICLHKELQALHAANSRWSPHCLLAFAGSFAAVQVIRGAVCCCCCAAAVLFAVTLRAACSMLATATAAAAVCITLRFALARGTARTSSSWCHLRYSCCCCCWWWWQRLCLYYRFISIVSCSSYSLRLVPLIEWLPSFSEAVSLNSSPIHSSVNAHASIMIRRAL